MKKVQAKAPPLRARRSHLVVGVVPPHATETAWVIFRPHDDGFWTGRTRHDFLTDDLLALRFCREMDARTVRDYLLGEAGLHVVHRTWLT